MGVVCGQSGTEGCNPDKDEGVREGEGVDVGGDTEG